jgi:hypothetical protein
MGILNAFEQRRSNDTRLTSGILESEHTMTPDVRGRVFEVLYQRGTASMAPSGSSAALLSPITQGRQPAPPTASVVPSDHKFAFIPLSFAPALVGAMPSGPQRIAAGLLLTTAHPLDWEEHWMRWLGELQPKALEDEDSNLFIVGFQPTAWPQFVARRKATGFIWPAAHGAQPHAGLARHDAGHDPEALTGFHPPLLTSPHAHYSAISSRPMSGL